MVMAPPEYGLPTETWREHIAQGGNVYDQALKNDSAGGDLVFNQ